MFIHAHDEHTEFFALLIDAAEIGFADQGRDAFGGREGGGGEGGELGYWPLAPVLPDRIAAVTLETEDRHFYEHSGVYVRSLARAAWQNLSHLRVVSGGSTLPMQVARMPTA